MSQTRGSSASHEISHLAVLEAEMETTGLLSETGHSYKHWNKFNKKKPKLISTNSETGSE